MGYRLYTSLYERPAHFIVTDMIVIFTNAARLMIYAKLDNLIISAILTASRRQAA